jgi:glycosyltransferase 2 family protein
LSENTKANFKKYILSLARIAVAVFAMYLAGRKVNWVATWEIIKGLNLGILAIAILLLVANTVIVASRWYLLLRLQSIEIGLMPAIKLTFLGFSYNQFLPSSVGGDVLRAWYVTKHTPKRLEAVLSVFVDRLIGLTGLVLSAFAAFLLFPKTGEIADNLSLPHFFTEYWWVFPTIVAVLATVLAGMLLVPRTRLLLKAGYMYAMTTGRHLFVKVSKAVFLYCCRPVWMLIFLLMTLFCQTLFIFGLWLAGRELGVNVGFAYYLVFIPVSWVIGMLPISIGGVGVMEGIMALLFAKLAGVNYDNAFAVAMCQRFLFWVVSLPGLFIHIAGTHVPEEFSIDSEAGIN